MPGPVRPVRFRRAEVRAAANAWLEQIPFRTAVWVLAGVLVLVGCVTTGMVVTVHGGGPAARGGSSVKEPVPLSAPVAQAIRPRPAWPASRSRSRRSDASLRGPAGSPAAHTPSAPRAGRARLTGPSSDPASPRPSPSRTVSAPGVVLAVSPDPAVTGQGVIYTATIRAGAHVSSVAFADDGVPISTCRRVVISAGSTRCQISYLQAGSHTITAIYSTAGGGQASSASAIETILRRG